MLRHRIFFLLLALAGNVGAQAQAGDAKSALETDPKGWTDLMPSKDLKGYQPNMAGAITHRGGGLRSAYIEA